MKNLLGYVLGCAWCGSVFVICKSCYRNHRYCSDECRKNGYKNSKKKARQKYDKSLEAKLDHRDRSRRHRLKNSVTDQTSNLKQQPLDSPTHEQIEHALFSIKEAGVCISCGQTVFQKEVNIYGRSL